jgi:hypothetical protein
MSALTVGAVGEMGIAAPLFQLRPYNGRQESWSWPIVSSFRASVKDGLSSLQYPLDALEPEGVLALALLQYHLNVITSRNQARSESSNAFAGRMKSPPTMSALRCPRALSWVWDRLCGAFPPPAGHLLPRLFLVSPVISIPL